MLRICYNVVDMVHIRKGSTIGVVLRERREGIGKSVAWIAQTVGVSRSTISRIESGKMNPAWSLVLAIGQALGLQLVLAPRERMAAVEAVLEMSDTPETPPLVGETW